jgi:hypothetical protein
VTEGEEVAPGVVADRPTYAVALETPRNLPPVARARVTRSVAYTAHHPVPGGGVRVTARQVPGRDGLVWRVRYDPGTDAADPRVAEVTGQLLAQAKSTVGLAE